MAFPTDLAELRKTLKGHQPGDIKRLIGEELKNYKNNHKSKDLKAPEHYQAIFEKIWQDTGISFAPSGKIETTYYKNKQESFQKGAGNFNECLVILLCFNKFADSETYIRSIESALVRSEDVQNHKLPENGEESIDRIDNYGENNVATTYSPPTNARPPIHSFTGRKKELRTIHALLSGSTIATAIVQSKMGKPTAAVHGLGGVGKTSLARQYADNYRSAYAGIWWCNAETEKTLFPHLHELATFLNIDREKRSDDQWALDAVRGLSQQNGTHLLIYDNAESPRTIKDFLPGSYARLLITSRFHDWYAYAAVLELDVLPLKDAVAMLRKRAPSVDAAGAELLAKTLGCLPLALDHAAAFCEEEKTTFQNYATEAVQRIAEFPDHSDYPNSVQVTFDMAIDKAVELCPEAETLIAYMAYCAPDQIPDLLIKGAIDDDGKRIQAIRALRRLSLIKDDPIKVQSPSDDETVLENVPIEPEDGQSFLDSQASDAIQAWSVHRLVQQIARGRSGESRTSILSKIGTRLNGIFPNTGYESLDDWPLCNSLMAHLWPIYEYDMESADRSDFSTAFNSAGLYMLSRGVMRSASDLLKRSLVIRQESRTVTQRELSKSLSDLALFHDTDGNLAEAEKLCEEALTIRRDAFGLLDSDTLISLNNLAYIYMEQGRFTRSYRLFKQALKLTIKVFGADDLETATALDNLSNCSRQRGRLEEALKFCEEGIAIVTGKSGENAVGLAASYESLAPIKYDLGRKDEAYEHYAKCEELCVTYYGTDHIASSASRMGMAQILIEREDFKEAANKVALALTSTQKTYGVNDDENARIMEEHASMLIKAQKQDEARSLLQKAIKIFQSNTPKRSPDVRRCRKILRHLTLNSDL